MMPCLAAKKRGKKNEARGFLGRDRAASMGLCVQQRGARVPTRTPTIFHGIETARLDNLLPCGAESYGLLDTVSHFFFYKRKNRAMATPRNRPPRIDPNERISETG